MEVAGLSQFLGRHNRVALDTSVFIYELESNAKYADATHLIFSWLEQSNCSALTSAITLTELLVRAYRERNEGQVQRYYGLFSTYPKLDWIPADLLIADTAARLRAAHRLQTPDAIQAATAIQSGATGLITNDSVFERVEDFETLVIEKLFI